MKSGGGGEYPGQEGFGWTNAVYLKFYEMFKQKPLENDKILWIILILFKNKD